MYPPAGKQRIGNCEVIECQHGLPFILKEQVKLNLVKVVMFRSAALAGEGDFEELCNDVKEEILKWKPVKELKETNQND